MPKREWSNHFIEPTRSVSNGREVELSGIEIQILIVKGGRIPPKLDKAIKEEPPPVKKVEDLGIGHANYISR